MRRAVFECRGNPGKCFFRLAHHHVVCHQQYGFRVGTRPGTAHEGPPAKTASARQDGQSVRSLRVHRAHHHQVRPQQILVAQFLKRMIDQPDLPRSRAQAATVIKPRGGVIARSGIISSTPSNPQNDGGKLGQAIRTLMCGPRGGKEVKSASSVGARTGRGTCGDGVLGKTFSRESGTVSLSDK